MSGRQIFTRKVINRSGRVLFLPSVASMNELYDAIDINPMAQSLTQEFPLGSKLVEGDRVWRYSRNGAGTLTPAMTLQGALVQNAAASVDIVVDAASAAGVYTVSLTSQAAIAVAANYYKEGYLFINDEAGEGEYYKIKSHDALVTTTAGSIFNLYSPIKTALTVASQVGLRKNPYDYVIVSAAPLTSICVGVAPIDVTAAYYFWAQRGGPCAVNAKVAIQIGAMVAVGVTAGQVDVTAHDATYGMTRGTQVIGYAMTPGAADTEKFLCYLTLES